LHRLPERLKETSIQPSIEGVFATQNRKECIYSRIKILFTEGARGKGEERPILKKRKKHVLIAF